MGSCSGVKLPLVKTQAAAKKITSAPKFSEFELSGKLNRLDFIHLKRPSILKRLPIRTKRLLLRRFRAGDLAPFFEYRSDPRVGLYQGWLPPTMEEATAFIKQAECATGDPGRWFQIAIALRKSDLLIGDIGLCMIANDAAEIGFTLAAAAQGHGYAGEAIASLISTLSSGCGITTLRAIADARNERSIALLQRLGFHLERTTGEVFRGQWCEQQRFMLNTREKGGSSGDYARGQK